MRLKSKFLNKINSTASIVIVIGLLIVLNFFSYNIFYRFDLTQNKDYSLSQASRKAAADLKDIVNVKAYFSADLPPQFLNLRQEVSDILDEYANYAGGKIRVEFIDPKAGQSVKQELDAAGIPELQFNALEKDKFQVINGYLGLLIKYGEKSQPLPVIQETKDLEYKITSAIKKLTSSKVPNIGFWQGNGAAGAAEEVSAAYKKLSEIYNVSLVNYAADKKVPVELDTLIIIGPKEKFSDDELKALDGFLTGGGSLVILADGVKVGEGLLASKNETSLNKILQSYGLKLNENLVLDVNNGLASFSQGFVTFTTNYPYWPKIVKAGFAQNNPAAAGLESLVLPWVSTIDVASEKTKNLTVSYLAQTSDRSISVADNFRLEPPAQISGGTKGKFSLAVSLAGQFTSAFNQANSKTSRLILVGDSDFIRDSFLRNYPDNMLFFQNIIDSLSLGDDLISIRAKGVTERPLKEISEPVKAAVRYFNIFGLTALVVSFGLARYFLRRRGRFEDEI